MLKTKKGLRGAVLVLMVVCLSLSGGLGTAMAEKAGTVKLVYVNWAEGIAMTNLVKTILEDSMNYDVELTMADVAPVFTSLAKGDRDAFLDGWLPVTHKTYLEEYGDDLVDLGYNYEGARIGLVVPTYLEDVNSIEDLKDPEVAKLFKGQITGIDSGAGIMKTTDKALEEYGLEDMRLLSASGPAMTASLKRSVRREQPIVVTGWKPHWKFATWDLKFLDDPKMVYGDVENIHTIVRKGLDKDMPEVVAFLKAFKLDDQQLGTLMSMVAESDDDPEQAARDWAAKNQELVNKWLEAAKSAE